MQPNAAKIIRLRSVNAGTTIQAPVPVDVTAEYGVWIKFEFETAEEARNFLKMGVRMKYKDYRYTDYRPIPVSAYLEEIQPKGKRDPRIVLLNPIYVKPTACKDLPHTAIVSGFGTCYRVEVRETEKAA